MKPNMEEMIKSISMTLLTDVAPVLDSEYSRKTTNMMAYILLNAGAEYDQAVEIRFQENANIRNLFSEAAHVVEDDDLRERIVLATKMHDTSLRISALDAQNDKLNELLIELHTYVEDLNTLGANKLEELIWSHLDNSASRRSQIFPGIAGLKK